MLRHTDDLMRYTLGARDGEIGRVKDLYFEDEHWAVRYLVADTNKWLPGRRVLLSPYGVLGIRDDDKIVDVNLTKDQIRNAPSIEEHQPISRAYEMEYYKYYQWPYYWQGPAMWGPLPRPGGSYGQVNAPPKTVVEDLSRAEAHLRSGNALHGYNIHARDGDIGHVEGFVIDDENWAVRYLVIDTRNWWPGKKVLVATPWVTSMVYEESKVYVDLDRDTIKQAPEYDFNAPISREFEDRLFAHYSREPYWNQKLAA